MRNGIRITALLLSCAALNACTMIGFGQRGEETRLLSLADDISQRGDHATAASMYERALELSGNDPELLVKLGNAHLAAGNLADAQSAFRTALALDLDNAEAQLGLGTAQLRLGEAESAVRNLRRAAPELDTLPAWSRLGIAHALLGQSEAASQAFARAVELSPRNPDTLTNLALARSLEGQHDDAIELMHLVGDSPLAEERHFRHMILVLVLAQQLDQAQSVDIPDMPAELRQSLIEHALRIGEIDDPGERARAMGLALAR